MAQLVNLEEHGGVRADPDDEASNELASRDRSAGREGVVHVVPAVAEDAAESDVQEQGALINGDTDPQDGDHCSREDWEQRSVHAKGHALESREADVIN